MSFNRVLVPFDNSKLSFKALDQAVELARMKSTEIIILHVIAEIPLPTHYSKIESTNNNRIIISPLANQVYEEIKNEMMPILEDIKKTHSENNISITTEIRIGDPAEKIIEFSNENNIDLVIMGSVGHKGFAAMLKKLGSVARKVSEEVNCPILIVR